MFDFARCLVHWHLHAKRGATLGRLCICLACAAILFLLAPVATVEAQSPSTVPSFPRTPPTEPPAATKTFEVLHGFEMQLIAAEPLIADPVDVAYDEEGRAYVVGMRDYPYPEEKGAAPTDFLGEVRLLEDHDGDGVFDRSHVFADKLSWPTSVACWKGGVFVAAAPDIWYFRDSDGDHTADVRRKVYTGFSRENVQAIVNGLRWGLDNHIYGAASGNGGRVVSVDQPENMPVGVTRHDFRFDPASGRFDAIAGGARFGNSFDDWGNRFVCNIRNPVQHVVLPGHYLARNRLLAAPPAIKDVAESGDQLPVYRISPPEAWRVFRAQRWAAERANFPRSELIGAGFWTSSSGVTIYRGTAYPAEFQANVFVGEVAGNLVHRQVLQPDGVSFVSRRADAQAEFVASRDIWFRPVNFVNAPDGTLHILDMYRETIEHPWSIPDDVKARLDLSRGNNRGRIYRLAPPGFVSPAQPRLGRTSTEELVAQLENPNAWWRETAQRLLYERQDKSAAARLRQLVTSSQLPQARLHALYTLAGLNSLVEPDLLTAMRDSVSHVRRHGVLLSESSLDKSPALKDRVVELASDANVDVRFQVAFTLGNLRDDRVAAALAKIAARDAGDPWARTAVLSSSATDPLAILQALVQRDAPQENIGVAEMVRELAMYVSASGEAEQTRHVAELLLRIPDSAEGLAFALVSGLGAGLQKHRQNLSSWATRDTETARQLRELLQRARLVAGQEVASVEQRVSAVELLRFLSPDETITALAPLLQAREPLPLQLASIRVLKTLTAPRVTATFIDQWKFCSSSARQEIVEALLSRPAWTAELMGALETERISPGQLTIPQRARLVSHSSTQIKERAVRLLGPAATTARDEMVNRYRSALALTPDRAHGEQVYRRECVTCHRLGSLGHDVGPNLNTVRHRSAEELLIHTLDPNREVPPQFISYAVQLRDGRLLSGIITSETDTSLELQRGDNARDVVLRRDVEQIVSTGKSLMPEGLEQKLSQQDVADLFAFLLLEGK